MVVHPLHHQICLQHHGKMHHLVKLFLLLHTDLHIVVYQAPFHLCRFCSLPDLDQEAMHHILDLQPKGHLYHHQQVFSYQLKMFLTLSCFVDCIQNQNYPLATVVQLFVFLLLQFFHLLHQMILDGQHQRQEAFLLIVSWLLLPLLIISAVQLQCSLHQSQGKDLLVFLWRLFLFFLFQLLVPLHLVYPK